MRWLQAHADSPPLVTPARARVAWLTGQSSWRHQRLSTAQERVLDGLAEHGWEPLRAGFPWTQLAVSAPPRPEPLGAASVRNTVQGLAAYPGSPFAADVARHLQPLLTATRDRLLLLCGSAGARLITGAAAVVDVPAGLVVDVVGIGPVGALPRSGGPWRVHAVRGRRDWLSAIGHARRFDAVVPGGHLDAATSPAMLEAVVRLVGPARGPA